MKLHVVGIDLGKTVFHLVGLDSTGNVVVRKRCSRRQLLAFTANLQVAVDWHGVVQWLAFSGTRSARAGAPGAIDAGAVREAVRADQQERLHRCGSYSGSGATAADALCADQDRKSNWICKLSIECANVG